MSVSTRVRATLIGLARLLSAVAMFGFGILLATMASAQMGDDGSCVYDRGVYSEGTQMCQGGQLMQCDEGAWETIGDCDDPQPEPAPIGEGGDVRMD